MSLERVVAMFSGGYEGTEEQGAVREEIARSIQELLCSPRITSGVPEAYIAEYFAHTAITANPWPMKAYLRFLNDVVVRHSVNMSSPRCLGHMTSGVPSFVPPLMDLVTRLNQNLVKREASRVLSLLERQVLAMLHRMVFRFPEEFYAQHAQGDASTLGVVTSGGTLSNLAALWVARNRAFPEATGFSGVERAGTTAALERYGFERAVVLCSSLAHYSVDKAAALLGLGEDGVIKLPVDARQCLDIDALSRAIKDCARRRWRVIAVVGIAGNTHSGSIDPLPQIADLAEKHRLHFHVDAAWGGFFLFGEAHRARLAGIERADSVTIDGHKQLYLPVSTSMLLFRDPFLANLLRKRANYILQDDSRDLGQISVEGSRSASSLLAHAALHLIGEGGYSALVDRALADTRAMSSLVSAAEEFELLLEPETNMLLYRYVPACLRERVRSGKLSGDDHAWLNEINTALQKAEWENGRTYVSRTTLTSLWRYRGVTVVALRAVLGNPCTSIADLEAVLQDQIEVAAGLEAAAEGLVAHR